MATASVSLVSPKRPPILRELRQDFRDLRRLIQSVFERQDRPSPALQDRVDPIAAVVDRTQELLVTPPKPQQTDDPEEMAIGPFIQRTIVISEIDPRFTVQFLKDIHRTAKERTVIIDGVTHADGNSADRERAIPLFRELAGVAPDQAPNEQQLELIYILQELLSQTPFNRIHGRLMVKAGVATTAFNKTFTLSRVQGRFFFCMKFDCKFARDFDELGALAATTGGYDLKADVNYKVELKGGHWVVSELFEDETTRSPAGSTASSAGLTASPAGSAPALARS